MIEKDPKRTVKVAVLDGFAFHAPPGSCVYYPDVGKLEFACPGCGLWGGVTVGHPKPERTPSWDIVSGTPEDPATLTLSPSILCISCCGWHGHLVGGKFVSC